MMEQMRDELLAGMVGGLAGAAVMRMAMMVGQKTGMVKTPVPLKVERGIEQRLGMDDKTTIAQEKALSQLGHFAIGALFGAGYGAFQSRMKGPAIPTGPLYGLGVFALNFMGIGPATGLTIPPSQRRPMSLGREVMTHLVYGAVTAKVAERVLEEMQRGQYQAFEPRRPMMRQEEPMREEGRYRERVITEPVP